MKAHARFRALYTAFKYSVYALLVLNIYLFFREEWGAAQHTFAGGLPPAVELIAAFSATIDTAAWVVLLLLFELETSVLSDEVLSGPLEKGLFAVRTVSYGFILYAFYGYVEECMALYRTSPTAVTDLCALGADSFSFMIKLNEYVSIGPDNCHALPAGGGLVSVASQGFPILTDSGTLDATRRLAWADVINAGDWILIVLLLELDVQLQMHHHLSKRIFRISKVAKGVLYSVLVACLVYWSFNGDFIDYWDAALWLVAFVFIEMNVIEWHAGADSG